MFTAGLFSACLLAGIGFSVLGEFTGAYLAAGVALAAAVTAVVLVHPLWAVALVLISAPIGNKALPGAPLGLQVVHAVCVLAIVAVLLGARNQTDLTRIARVEIRPPLFFGVMFILAAVLATGFSPRPMEGFKTTATLIAGLLLTAGVILVAKSHRRLRLLLGATTLGSLGVTAYSFIGGQQLVALYGAAIVQNREVGTFTDPNTFGSFCMLTIFVALAWLLAAEHRFERLVAIAGVLSAGAAMTVSLSRGAWLGTVIGAIVLVLLDPKARSVLRRFGVAAIVVGLLALLVLPVSATFSVVIDRALSVSSLSTNPYDVRPITWREALREFEAAPVLGSGPGSFSVLSAQSGSELQFYPRRHAHNGLLTIAAEMGAVGAVAAVGLVGSVALAVRNRVRRLRASEQWPQLGALAASAAGLAAMLGHLLVDYPLRNPVLMIALWAVLGMVLAMVATPVPPRRVLSARPSASLYDRTVAVPIVQGSLRQQPDHGDPTAGSEGRVHEPDRTRLLPMVVPAILPTVANQDGNDVQLRRLARSGTLSFIGAMVSGVLGFAVVVLVSRVLGAFDAGVFALAVAVFMTLSVAGRLGCDTGLVRILPPLRASTRPARIHAVVRAALVPVTVGLTVIAAAMWWLAPLVAPVLLPDTPSQQSAQLLRVVAALLPLGTASYVALAATRGLGSMKPFVAVENIVKPVARCAFVGIVLLLGAGVFGATVAWAVGTVIGVAVSAWSLRRALAKGTAGATGIDSAQQEGELKPWRELWSFSAPRGISSICEIVGLHIGVVLVSSLAGTAEAGIFNAALRLVLAGTLAMQALRLATAPQVSQLLNNAQAGQVQRLHHTSSGWVIALSWPLYLLMLIWPEHVLSMFGDDFTAGATSLVVLAGAMLVNLYTGNVVTLLLMSGGSGATLAVTIASLVVQVTLCAVLAPTLGALGAAIAKAVSVVGENLALTLLVRDKLGVRTISKPTLLASGLALLCFAVPAAILRIAGVSPTGGTGLALATAGVVLGTLAYGVGLWKCSSALQLGTLAEVARRRGAPSSRRKQPANAERRRNRSFFR